MSAFGNDVTFDVDVSVVFGLFREGQLWKLANLELLHDHLLYRFLKLLVEVARKACE